MVYDCRPGVMHLVDTLNVGGLERVAVNLANALPSDRYRLYLCTTRSDGPLDRLLRPEVGRVRLGRRWRFDLRGVSRLTTAIAAHDIRILHAHGSALFIAALASLRAPRPSIVWHDHYGRYMFDDRPVWLYRLATRRVDAVVSVNIPLADWARTRLFVRADRVMYVPNFAAETPPSRTTDVELPGVAGARLACVANLRPQKDHRTLFAAMSVVARRVPDAHLLVVGAGDPLYAAELAAMIRDLHLQQHVSFLGHREDIAAILRQVDVGVLSSASEGFPLALVEYGNAALGVVATRVGQCPEVLDDGRAGLIVPPGDADALASAIVLLLQSPPQRSRLGERLHRHVAARYAQAPIVDRICRMYDAILPPRVSVTAA